MKERLKEGAKLECPREAPAKIGELMQVCGSREPSNRPQFSEVHGQLEQLYAELGDTN